MEDKRLHFLVRAEEIVRLAIVGAALFLVFHLEGNTADRRMFGPSLFRWMTIRWGDATFNVGDYSHGWLIPLVSLYVLWRNRRAIVEAPKSCDWTAAPVVAGACALHWLGARAQQPRVSLMAFILLLWAIPWLFYGRRLARILVFPCFYLVFCIPMNFFDVFSFSLRIFATKVSVAVLNGLAIPVVRTGSAIRSVTGQFNIEVADPCSGIRSLLAMAALATAYAHFALPRFWKQASLVAASIPIVVAGNVARIVSIGVVGSVMGEKAALRYYHDASGYVVFAVAALLLAGCASVLRRLPYRFSMHLLQK